MGELAAQKETELQQIFTPSQRIVWRMEFNGVSRRVYVVGRNLDEAIEAARRVLHLLEPALPNWFNVPLIEAFKVLDEVWI